MIDKIIDHNFRIFEKNVFTFDLSENKSNDEDEQDDKSTINAFISFVKSVSESSSE
jgi:hypothetical protein